MKKVFIILVITATLAGCKTLNRLSDSEISISGTTWQYTDSDWTYTITFNPDGKLRSTHPNDKTPDNDFWSQSRENISFQFNNGISKYTGKMESLKRIVGKTKSESGEWDWTMTKIE